MNRFLSLFSGRMNRIEFFIGFLFFLVFSILWLYIGLMFSSAGLSIGDNLLFVISSILYFPLALLMILLTMKRLRDMGIPTLWTTFSIFYFPPFLGFADYFFPDIVLPLFMGVAPAFLLFCLAWPSKKHENDLSPSPQQKETVQ